MESKRLARISYLIAHHLMEVSTSGENAELEQWLSENEQNRLLLKEIGRWNFYSEKQFEEHLYNHMSAYGKVWTRKQQRQYKIRRRRIWTGIAAAIVLVMGMAVSLLQLPGEIDVFVTDGMELTAGESKAVLILEDGRRMELGQYVSDSLVLSSGVSLDAAGEELKYKEETARNEIVKYNVLEVPRKGEFRLVLADGTKVWMNSESRLKYPVYFQGKERRVYLEGEAYFEVKINADMPFVVDMGKTSIQVLGTSFNARAYKEEEHVYATLAEGKIRLALGERTLVLKPEEQGIVDLKKGYLSKEKVDLRLYTGWKDGRFIFQEQTLEEMMNTLARWYDIKVFYENSSVRKVTFSGNLKRYDGFDKIIEMLEMTGMAHFKVKGNTILISE